MLRRYFATGKYSSFARQMSHYGFVRFVLGPDKGAFYHEFMLRGRPDLVFWIERRQAVSSLGAIAESRKAKANSGSISGTLANGRRTQKRLRSRVIPPDLTKFPVCPRSLDLDHVLNLCTDSVCMPNRLFSFSENYTVGMVAHSYDRINDRYHVNNSGNS